MKNVIISKYCLLDRTEDFEQFMNHARQATRTEVDGMSGINRSMNTVQCSAVQ